jgi:hypothetical protein
VSRAVALGLAGLAAAVLATLFEPLFLDRTVLGVDVRVFPPFSYHATETEPRSMNVMSFDLASWLLPERIAQLRALADGQAPLWNPGEGMGQPLLATLGDAPFYPARALDLALGPARAIAVALALHLLLLGAGTHLALRRAGLHAAAQWLGATVMMLSGYAAAHFQTPLIVHALAWTPWMHLALARFGERPTTGRAGALGLAVGASFLAGFPQVSCLGLLAAAVLAPPRTLRAAAGATAAVLCGGALAAVHLLPATELLEESWRAGGWSAEELRAKSLAPQSLIGFVLPGFFGSPVAEVSPAVPVWPSPWEFPSYAAWQTQEVQNNFEENVLYAGLIPLALAAAACLRPGRPRRAALGLLAVLLVALAPPVVADLVGHLPGMRHGSPKRALLLAPYALAWLAALEVDRLARAGPRERARGLALGAAALTVLGLALSIPFETLLLPQAGEAQRAWFRDVVGRDLARALFLGLALFAAYAAYRLGRRPLAFGLLLAGTAGELVDFARHVNPYQPHGEELYPETPAIAWLRAHGAADDVRIVSFGDTTVLTASVAQLFGLRSCNAMASLLPRRPGELLRALEPEVLKLDNPCFLGPLRRPESLASPILDLAGARYAVAGISGYLALREGDPALGVTLAYKDEAERIAIYERASALPPAFLVEELRVVPEPEERLAALSAPGFDPARTALLAEAAGGAPRGGLAQGAVSYRRAAPGSIELELATGGPAFLVVTETYMEGWRCEVDGAAAEVVPADHAFLGVPLPAGARRVRLAYAPRSFTRGCWVSAAAGAALLAACAAGRVRRRPTA